MDKQFVIEAFAISADVKQQFAQTYAQKILDVAQIMIRAFNEGRKILLFGNGGSATDASHLAAEFVGRYRRDRTPLPALALTTDMAALTCIANDYDYQEIFARQIQAHGRKGDVAIAISTSGNSKNILCAMDAAQEQKMSVIALTKKSGGQMKAKPSLLLGVDSEDTARIQEGHITILHALCEIVEQDYVQ